MTTATFIPGIGPPLQQIVKDRAEGFGNGTVIDDIETLDFLALARAFNELLRDMETILEYSTPKGSHFVFEEQLQKVCGRARVAISKHREGR